MDSGSRVQSHEIIVPRTSRYAVLGAGVSRAEEVWLVCHGYGQLASRFIHRFGVLDNGKRLIVAPEALSRFYLSSLDKAHSEQDRVGASWMTREGRDAEIADQVTYLDMVSERVRGGSPRRDVRFVGFGFSQGAATICRWAARARVPPDRIILWGSGVPADLLHGKGREGLARADLTIVVGTQDPVVERGRVALHRQELDAAGLPYRLLTYEGGHEIDGRLLAEIADGIGDTPGA